MLRNLFSLTFEADRDVVANRKGISSGMRLVPPTRTFPFPESPAEAWVACPELARQFHPATKFPVCHFQLTDLTLAVTPGEGSAFIAKQFAFK